MQERHLPTPCRLLDNHRHRDATRRQRQHHALPEREVRESESESE